MFGKKKPIFADLLDATVDSRTSISDVLRKAKLLAYELDAAEFKDWVDWELSGYPEGATIPGYRCPTIPALGTFSGPFGGMVKRQVLPVFNLPDELQEMAQVVILGHSCAEIEEMSNRGKELQRAWPAEAVILARDHIPMSGGFVLVEAYQPLTPSVLKGIVDNVRNRLLDFLMRLQEQHPDLRDSGEVPRKMEASEVGQIFNIAINGDNATLAAGKEFTQEVHHGFDSGDLEGLLAHIRELGVPEDEVASLERAISRDGRPVGRQFGAAVKEWLGSLITRIANGTVRIATSTAPTVIAQAIAHYYNLNG